MLQPGRMDLVAREQLCGVVGKPPLPAARNVPPRTNTRFVFPESPSPDPQCARKRSRVSYSYPILVQEHTRIQVLGYLAIREHACTLMRGTA